MDNQPSPKGKTIKSIYFYLVSFVALMIIVFSLADLINTALKTWAFTKADTDMYPAYPMCEVKTPDRKADSLSPEECAKQQELNRKQSEQSRAAQKQRNIVRDISMVVVGIPLFLIHWRIVRSKDENL